MRVENTSDDERAVEPFAGIVAMDAAGRVSDTEHERLRRAILANYRVAESRSEWREEYLTAERRIANNIKDTRLRSGQSQEQLATSLHMFGFDLHQSTIAKIEAGKRPIRLAEMFAIADALSVPWTSLMEGGRDIDILPTEDMIPVDIWEAGLQELVFQREDVMADIIQTVEMKARSYAELDRMILVRIAALANAAARAKQSDDAHSPEIDALVEKWLMDASASARAQAEYESPQRQAEFERRREAMDAESSKQSALIDEFLEWRRGQAPNAAE